MYIAHTHCPKANGDNGWIGIDARLSLAPGSNGIRSNEIAVQQYLALAILGIAVENCGGYWQDRTGYNDL